MGKQEIKEQVENQKILARIKDCFDLCQAQYAPEHKKMRLLDSIDRGDFWKALQAKMPSYQILADTNYITYVKNNILASIYTVVKGASVIPTSEQDKDIVALINIALEQTWDLIDVGYKQFQAGERAALLNMGVTQVGWDENLIMGKGDSLIKGNVSLKNIDPIKFMRDPFATDLESAGYCMTYDQFHKSIFEKTPLYKEGFAKYYASTQKRDTPLPVPELQPRKNPLKDYFTLLIFWERVNGKVNEYHTINGEALLCPPKMDIKPSEFPFAVLYCNEPAGDLIGSSECKKILANNIAYNIIDSVALTAEYKNQRPPKFISRQSGLNIQTFAKHGDEADKTFIVNGRADQAVHYHQFPQVSSVLPHLKQSLDIGVQKISGIDGRYTGRDTGSVITTGGVEDMLNRVTLIDTPKITLYEAYTKRLTKLILSNMLHFSPKRKYFRRKPNSIEWASVEVDFPKIDNDTLFAYAIHVSSELPKNKQRLAAWADAMMEKQMQYSQEGSSVQLITEEEWLMFQDIPNKEYMLERMGVQRMSDATEEVAQTLFGYAELIKQGMAPDQAMLAMAQSLQDKRMGMAPETGPMQSVVMEQQQPPMMEAPVEI